MSLHDWRLLSRDEITGKEAWIKLDPDGRTWTVRTVMPVDDLLAENAELHAMRTNERWGDGQNVARVPIHIWQRELAEAQCQGDEKYVRRWLNDPSHSKFRTRGGRL